MIPRLYKGRFQKGPLKIRPKLLKKKKGIEAHEISGCSKTKILTCNYAFGHDTVCAACEAVFLDLGLIDIWNLMFLCCGASCAL